MALERQLHKFGGSSLANAECYKRVAKILGAYSNPTDLVVVSAAGNTTNLLIKWIAALEQDGRLAHEYIQELRQFQFNLVTELITDENSQPLLVLLESEFKALGEITAPVDTPTYAKILSYGEVWSSRLLTALLCFQDKKSQQVPARQLDTRLFLRAEQGAQPEVDRSSSLALLNEILVQYQHTRIVMTGFIASNTKGETILLGRNGSDYSATVIGELAQVSRVTIWSDVAGVYSADPRIVSDACLLPLLRLDEASELARLATPVLHSRTLQPVAQSAMDLSLRCSYQPESGSTRIERVLASGRGAKIVTTLDEVVVIEISFDAGHDKIRLQEEAIQSLRRTQLNPLAMEWQPDTASLQLAYTAEIAEDAFTYLQDIAIEGKLKLKEGYSMIAAVGAGVTNNANHCYGFFQQLKNAPVEFITEAKSGLSITAILRTTNVGLLAKQVHSQLFQANKRVGIVLCGKGNIGSGWLSLFNTQKAELERRSGMSFDIITVVGKKNHLIDLDGISATKVESRFKKESVQSHEYDWLDIVAQQSSADQHSQQIRFDEIVVMDVTASASLSRQYEKIAEHGMHLICANKIAGSASTKIFNSIKDAFSKTGRHWFCNATVGAGLPVNYAIRDLHNSGDTITAVSGIFSGTLSWLFQQFDGTVPFIELVDLAWQQGLTEPDPRFDLDGTDVMRKLVILAREAGFEIEPEDIKVESLVPDELKSLTIDEFFEQADALNEALLERLVLAQKEDKVLRYIARLDDTGEATVSIEAVSAEHALANLLPCDNIFAIESHWYKDNPLVIRGPGAGNMITAGALQSDLNRLSIML